MEPDKQELCSICNGRLSSCGRTTIAEIVDSLKFIFVKVNSKLLQDSLICQTCLSKIEAAIKFKAFYSDVSQKTQSWMVKEEPDSESCIRCEICKSAINSDESIPLFYSGTETGLSLIKYFSPQFEFLTYEDCLSCESCHKSLINFYDITNLLSMFNDDHIDQINNRNNVNIKEESQWTEDVYNDNVAEFFRTDLREEMNDTLEDVKEIEIEECLLKIEKSDFKIENEEESVEIKRTGQQQEQKGKFNSIILDHITSREDGMFKCQICTYKTKRKNTLKMHMVRHKKFDEVEMLKCQICTFATKHKNYLKRHMLVHTNSNEMEMYKCYNCEFKTRYKASLRTHMIVHKNSVEVEMLKCQICTYETKRKNNLKMHMVRHKKSDGVKMLKCQICIQESKHENVLGSHICKHKNYDEVEMYNCYNCEFKSKHKASLRNHMRIHINSGDVEMLTCRYCEFKTKYKGSLRSHMFKHKSYLQDYLFIHKNSNEVEIY